MRGPPNPRPKPKPRPKGGIGSDFDSDLKEEGVFAEVIASTAKRQIAKQVSAYMKDQGLNKTAMAKKMGGARMDLNRLLDPKNTGITLRTLGKVAEAMSADLVIILKEKP